MCMTCIQQGDHGQPCPRDEAEAHAPDGYIDNAKDALAFMLGGNATFTIVSVRTGERYTYQVRAARGGTTMFFVSTLIGSDNENDYAYVGHFRAGEYAHGLKAGEKGNADDVRFKAFEWVLRALLADRMPRTVEFWHEGRCARCNRKLTDPESIASGFGPECRKRAA